MNEMAQKGARHAANVVASLDPVALQWFVQCLGGDAAARLLDVLTIDFGEQIARHRKESA